MLIEQIDFSASELNSGTLQTKQSVDYTPIIAGQGGYRPSSIRINNNSGGMVNVGLWTYQEYEKWEVDNTISTLLSIADEDSESFNVIKGHITYVTASGSLAGHDGSVEFILLRD